MLPHRRRPYATPTFHDSEWFTAKEARALYDALAAGEGRTPSRASFQRLLRWATRIHEEQLFLSMATQGDAAVWERARGDFLFCQADEPATSA